MKHALKLFLVTTAAVGAAASTAKADLNINGETGLFLNPSAAIVQKGRPQIQANYYDLGTEYKDKLYGLYGAVAATEKLEISGGVNRFKVGKDNWSAWGRSGFALSAKYQLYNEEDTGLQVAIGAGYDRALLNNIHLYAAATKAFKQSAQRAPVVGTLGIRGDRFTDFRLSRKDENTSKASVFAGVEVPLTSEGDLSLLAEIQSKNTDGTFGPNPKFPYAVGVRYRPRTSAFSLGAGFARQGITSPHDTRSRVFVQAGYTFGS